jgi:uncharacterized protein (TIGR03437 family)
MWKGSRLTAAFALPCCQLNWEQNDSKATEGVEGMTSHRVFSALFGLWPILTAASTPTPTYGTYFGGTGDTNVALAVTIGASGEVIVAGYTTSRTLPGTAQAFQSTKANGFPNNQDVFVAKFDSTARILLWTTFLGGDSDDVPTGLAVDLSGNIYVTGTTRSSNYPLQPVISCVPISGFFNFNSSPPFSQNCSTGAANPNSPATSFVSKISPDGTRLVYSIGIASMQSSALTVNTRGEVYVAAIGPGVSGGGFLFRLNAAGTALVYGAYLGGAGFTRANITSLVADALGNCYVSGNAVTNIPTTSNALQPSNSNADLSPNYANGFLLEVSPAGSQVIYGTWFGPKYAATTITDLTLNPDGSVYFSGITTGTTLQATPGAYQSAPAPGFIAKLTPGRATVDFFSYLPEIKLPLQFAENGARGGITHVAVPADRQLVYVAFGPDPELPGYSPSSGVIELTPTLAHVSSFVTSRSVNAYGFGIGAGSAWLVGSCPAGTCNGSLDGTISADGFQVVPAGTSSAVLFQLTDILSTITTVVNAASFQKGPISPGEIITIIGTGIGPTTPAGLALDQTGKVAASFGGVQVLFSGTAAPLTYVSATQINCVVPYEIRGLVSPYVQVSYQGQLSSMFPLTSAPTSPALFTANGSGAGPAAAFNQDQSYNLPGKPAPKGSTVVVFMTGEGLIAPSGMTGKITTVSPNPPITPQPILPVAVFIDGQQASIAFYGEAPGLVSGVMQLNVQIPPNVPSGNLPITVFVGTNSSQSGVTVSVQ